MRGNHSPCRRMFIIRSIDAFIAHSKAITDFTKAAQREVIKNGLQRNKCRYRDVNYLRTIGLIYLIKVILHHTFTGWPLLTGYEAISRDTSEYSGIRNFCNEEVLHLVWLLTINFRNGRDHFCSPCITFSGLFSINHICRLAALQFDFIICFS